MLRSTFPLLLLPLVLLAAVLDVGAVQSTFPVPGREKEGKKSNSLSVCASLSECRRGRERVKESEGANAALTAMRGETSP